MLNLHKCEFYTLHPRIQVLKQFFKQTQVFFFFFSRRLFKRQTLRKESTSSGFLVTVALTTGIKAHRHQKRLRKLLAPGHCPSASPTPPKKAGR